MTDSITAGLYLNLGANLSKNANEVFDLTVEEDQQVTVRLSSNSFDSEVQNAGGSELRGFEIETNYVVSENLSIYGSIGFTDTEFTDFVVELDDPNLPASQAPMNTDLSGNEFSRAPDWTLSAGLTWRNGQGWIANVNANYTAESFNSVTAQNSANTIPSRTLVNFRAGWSGDNFGVFVIGRNIFEDEHFDSFSVSTNIGRWGQPRVFGLSLEANL